MSAPHSSKSPRHPTNQTLLQRALRLLDRGASLQTRPFDCPQLIRPNVHKRLFSVSHYGIMIPNLPEPFRFFSLMSIIGTAGQRFTDTDHMLVDMPRRNATQVSGTAASGTGQFASYSIDRDCKIEQDGSLIRLGRDVTMSGTYPDVRLQVTRDAFDLDISLHCCDNVTWFANLPIYKHLGLMADYRGHIDYLGQRHTVNGICTYEYFTMIGPYGFRARPLPETLKLPTDFFTYQIVEIDENTQLMFAKVGIGGVTILEAAFLRERGVPTRTYSTNTRFTITSQEDLPRIAPDGRSMHLPSTFTWTVLDGDLVLAEIMGTVDTPFLYGLCSGYVGGYHYQGSFRGKQITGRGYIEYVDQIAPGK